MSGIRISQFKKPKTIIVDQARVDSSYGPKSSILLETGATNYSKNGFTIEVKGLSRDSLLNGMFVSVPIQVRWKATTGTVADGAINILPSIYFDLDDPVGYKAAFDNLGAPGLDANKLDGWTTEMRVYDSLCIRPNAFKCIRNATLSINGSSFSTRVDSYYTALCKLFCDGRQEEISGAAYESYPYSNCGDSRQLLNQRGWFERCKNVNARGKVKKVEYDNANHIKDLVFEYDVKFPIWFGPFTHLGFPGLSGFDGQSVSSIPYVSDLVLECTFQDDVLMDAFAGPDMVHQNAIRSNSPGFQPLGTNGSTDWAPDTHTMWNSCLVSDKGITSENALVRCGLLQPKLCYMFSEPDPEKMSLASIYTLPSYRFITYEDRKSIAADKDTVKIEFPYIRLSNISSLYVCMAEAARVDVGDSVAARSGRYSAANTWDYARLGLACANRTCPIKWDTVRVSMSTSSSVLTNFVKNTITEQRQYELFQKYSANAMALTFDQWKESSQMLLFSAEELCGIGAFANSFQALTLSISFDVYRDATDTLINAEDYTTVSAGTYVDYQFQSKKGQSRARAVIGRLICLEPELVSISEGAVSVEQVKLSQQEIHNQLMSGAPEVEDANQLDTLAR